MKIALTKHYCMECGWSVTNFKQMDGLKCPRCKGLIYSQFVKQQK